MRPDEVAVHVKEAVCAAAMSRRSDCGDGLGAGYGGGGEDKVAGAERAVAGEFERDGGALDGGDFVGIEREFGGGQSGVGGRGEADDAAKDVRLQQDFDRMPCRARLAAGEGDLDRFGEAVELAGETGGRLAEGGQAQDFAGARLADQALDRLCECAAPVISAEISISPP